MFLSVSFTENINPAGIWWIGLTDMGRKEEGKFRWSDGSELVRFAITNDTMFYFDSFFQFTNIYNFRTHSVCFGKYS